MSDAASRVGSHFGPYQLRRLLGRGGMGEVYEAEDTRKHRVVALKLVSREFSGNPVFRARMQREADTAGRLTEPHVVPIHDYGEIDGQFFVEMRMIDGVSLRTLLTQYGPLPAARAVAIVRQVAAALDAAHASGVTHRDVKPENILITNNDFAYLVDFGIARAGSDPNLTQRGVAVGTYNYMAPERFTGDDVTYRADIYALSCVLAECLTGAPPYRAETVERLIAAHLLEPAPLPSHLRPGRVPPQFDAVIARGMAKNPADRFPTAGDLAIAAHDALTQREQHHENTILRQDGDNATLLAGVPAAGRAWTNYAGADPQTDRVPRPAPGRFGDETMARPVAANLGDSWRSAGQRVPAPPSAAQPSPGPGDWRGHPSDPHGASLGSARPAALDKTTGSGRSGKRNRWVLIGAAAAVVVAVVAVAGFLVSRPSSPAQQEKGQSVLPFNGLTFRLSPGGVALDSSGAVYVTNQGMYGRVVMLAAGSNKPTVKPFTGLYEPQGVAVDGAGTVYVTDFNNRVVTLPAGSNNQKELPFTGLNYPEGVAVDSQGSVYVADRANSRVVKLPAGSSNQVVLPFDGLKNPDGIAVDAAGNVYVADTDNNRVVRLEAGSNAQTVLPFPGLSVPWGIAVDNAGDVFVTDHDNNQVMKLAAGSSAPTVLPFTGLNTPLSVTVDKDGNIYVADRGNGRVVKFTP